MKLSEFILAYRALCNHTKGKCFYCGIQTYKKGKKEHHAVYQTKDHVIPQSTKLGDCPESRANRVICCRSCNKHKGDLTLQEFKYVNNLPVFYAETLLGVKIDDLEDMQEINSRILTKRDEKQKSHKSLALKFFESLKNKNRMVLQ